MGNRKSKMKQTGMQSEKGLVKRVGSDLGKVNFSDYLFINPTLNDDI